jgi:hypothetical protein
MNEENMNHGEPECGIVDLYAVWQRWLAQHPDQSWKTDCNDWRIVPWAREIDHIDLTCRHHQALRWSNQNLKHVGYKTITFRGDLADMRARPCLNFRPKAVECACSWLELFVVVPEYAELLPVNIK